MFCGFPCTSAFSTRSIYRNGLKPINVFLEMAVIRSRWLRHLDVLEMRIRSPVFVCLVLRLLQHFRSELLIDLFYDLATKTEKI